MMVTTEIRVSQVQTAQTVVDSETVHFLEKIEMIECVSTGRKRREERARDLFAMNAAKTSRRKDSDSRADSLNSTNLHSLIQT